MTDDLEVEIRFTATKGIESLIVEIDGELGAGLPDVGLVPRFDLVDPETYQDGLPRVWKVSASRSGTECAARRKSSSRLRVSCR